MTIVQSNSIQPLLTFHNLETLTIKRCWSMKSLFPVSIANSLLQLKELQIFSSGLEEIVAKEEVDGTPRFLFPQLTFLKLDYLPKLQHFDMGLHTREWPMLKKLLVYNCEKIKVTASNGESQPDLFSFEKVIPNLEWLGLDADNIASRCLDRIPARSFKKLEFLGLVNCDNESIAFWFGVLQKLYQLETLYLCDGTFQELDYQVDTFLQNLLTLRLSTCHLLKYPMPSSTTSFKNIKNLEVYSCNGLAYILACLAARTLVHLTKIKIEEYKLVTEVIASEVETTEQEIVFSQLKILELHSLASLTSFCSANYSFEFPCLEQVIVNQCPNLKIFSQGGLNTPKLKKVQLTEKIDGEYLWNDDLNSTIHHMFTNMVLDTRGNISDARVLAQQHIWAAIGCDKAKNQAFNCTNGDVFTWKSLWKVLCQVFEVEFVGFDDEIAKGFDAVEMMKEKGQVWDEIVKKHGLLKTKLEEITCFDALTTVLSFDFQHVCSMNKSREFGFHGFVDTFKSIRMWVGRLRDMKIIP